jgi:ribosomal protein S18
MKKFTVYGNCQARVIASVLSSSKVFKSEFEYFDIKAVHLMTPNELEFFIEQILPQLDLFIFQPVSNKCNNDERYSTNYLLSKLKSDAISISFPSCYFRGYNPEMKRTKLIKHGVDQDEFNYHDQNLIKNFLSENIVSPEDFLSSDCFYSEDFSYQAVEESITELELRESNMFGSERQIDIKVSQFIRDNYQKQRLFYTFNHPSTALLIYIGKAILRLLEFEDEIGYRKDPFAHTIHPIYKSHYQNLKLKFDNPMVYKINNQEYQDTNFIQKYISYYSKIPKKSIEQKILC